MDESTGVRNTKSLIWGLFLIALGGAFLLERFGVIDAPALGDLWPLVFWVIAINRFITRRLGSGAMFLLLGAWFLACNFDWMGFSYENSWPVVLVAVGVGIVIRAVTGERPRRCCCTEVRHDGS